VGKGNRRDSNTSNDQKALTIKKQIVSKPKTKKIFQVCPLDSLTPLFFAAAAALGRHA
jgi:hypothetical protein